MNIDLDFEEKKILEELAALEKEGEKETKEEYQEQENEQEQEQVVDAVEQSAEQATESEDDDEELAGLGKKEKKGFARLRKELKEEKTLRETLAQQLQEMRDRQAKLEGMQEVAHAKTSPQQTSTDSEPDRDLDPDEWRDWKIRQQEKQINDIIGTTQKNSEIVNLQNEIRGVEKLEQAYSARDPEYGEKISFLKKLEADKLRLLQPNITDAQIEAAILRDKLTISRHLYNNQNQRDPAEFFADLAVKQGYVSKKGTVGKKQIDVAALNKNMKKNTSLLGGTSQAPAGDEVTPQELLNMSLEKMASIPKERLNRIMSGMQL